MFNLHFNRNRLFALAATALMVTALLITSLPAQAADSQRQDEEETPWLGATLYDDEFRSTVLVSDLPPQSPAGDAGVRVGDEIVAIDGEPVSTASQVRDAVQAKQVGDTLELSLHWMGTERLVPLTLQARPSDEEIAARGLYESGLVSIAFILRVMGLDGYVSEEGYVIDQVLEDSALAGDEFESGDILTEFNGVSLIPSEFNDADLETVGLAGDSLSFTATRDGETVTIETDRNLNQLIGDAETIYTQAIQAEMEDADMDDMDGDMDGDDMDDMDDIGGDDMDGDGISDDQQTDTDSESGS